MEVMEPIPECDPDDNNPEHEDSNAATSPSNGVPSAVAAAGGADASSPSPPPAAPVDRPQERAREQGTHGSSSASAAVGVVDRKGKGVAIGPLPALSPPRSAETFEAGESSSAAIDSNKAEGQAKSSHAKKGRWSKLKNIFSRREKIVDREERNIYSEHVDRQTLPITEIGTYYGATEDMPIRLDLDAFSRFRPVRGDGECFYRSFIFSYLEQVLDRQDTREEHRLLGILKRVSTQHTNLGWSSEFPRCYKAFKKLIKKVMGWKRQGRWSVRASTNSYREEKLLEFFSNYETTEDILAFLRLVAAIQMCSREDEYVQRIPEINENYSLKDWCFQYVTPSREFTDHVIMVALGTALEVPLRLEQLFGAGGAQDIYIGPGVVNVMLLYTGNHYDIIYPAESSRQQTSYNTKNTFSDKEKKEAILDALRWTDKNRGAEEEEYDKKLKEVEAVILPKAYQRSANQEDYDKLKEVEAVLPEVYQRSARLETIVEGADGGLDNEEHDEPQRPARLETIVEGADGGLDNEEHDEPQRPARLETIVEGADGGLDNEEHDEP